MLHATCPERSRRVQHDIAYSSADIELFVRVRLARPRPIPGTASLGRHVVNHEHIGEQIELPEQCAKLRVFGVRQVGIPRFRRIKC